MHKKLTSFLGELKRACVLYLLSLTLISQAQALPVEKSGGWVFIQNDNQNYKTPNPTHIAYHFEGELSTSFIPSEDVKNIFRNSMNYWEQIANVRFVETENDGIVIKKANVNPLRPTSKFNFMRTCPILYAPLLNVACTEQELQEGSIKIKDTTGDIYEDQLNAVLARLSMARNDYNRQHLFTQLVRHELGHILGLAHPGTGRNILNASQYDTRVSSIMYTPGRFVNDGGLSQDYFRASEADKAAAQQMYGAGTQHTFTFVNRIRDYLPVKINIYHASDKNFELQEGSEITLNNNVYNKYYKNKEGQEIYNIDIGNWVFHTHINFRSSDRDNVLTIQDDADGVTDPYVVFDGDNVNLYEDTFSDIGGYTGQTLYTLTRVGKSIRLVTHGWASEEDDPLYSEHSFTKDPTGVYEIYFQFDADNNPTGHLDIKFPISGWDEHQNLWPGDKTTIPLHYTNGQFTSPAKHKALQGYISLNDDATSDDLIIQGGDLTYTASRTKIESPFLSMTQGYFHGTVDHDGVNGTATSSYIYVTKDPLNPYRLTIHIKKIM